MKRSVLNWKLEINDEDQEMEMPAQPVSYVGWHGSGRIGLWVDTLTEMPKVRRVFRVYGTGHPVEGYAVYVGTVHDPHGFVWHVFERTQERLPVPPPLL